MPTKTFSIDPERWDKFIGKTGDERRQASPVLRDLIDAYLVGEYNPYDPNGVDWHEQARIAFRLEQLR